jgi:hypothetical protein
MKKINIYLPIISALFIVCTLLFVACEKNDDESLPTQNSGNVEFDKFFSSESYKEFSSNFDFDYSNFQTKEMVIQEVKEKEIKIFYLPIVKNSKLMGRIMVISQNNGQLFRALYENWEKLDNTVGGYVNISTTKNQFIASLKYTPTASNKFLIKISKVAITSQNTRLKAKAVEFNREDPWWKCTTECYAYLKSVCSNDSQCDFLCDLVNLYTGCFLSLSAGCAIYCM